MKKTLINIGILFSIFSVYSFVYAQETPEVPGDISGIATTTIVEYTPEEIDEIRTQFLERLGLPADRPYSILEQFRFLDDTTTNDPLDLVFGDLSLDIDTKTLSPGTTVTLSANTNSADKRLSDFVWYHNGNRVLSGIGKSNYSLTLGPIGTQESIRLSVTSPDKKVTKEITRDIYPARAHITWFSESQTPAWYRGKALIPPGSEINFAVVPEVEFNGIRVNPDSLLYEWSIGDGVFSKNTNVSGVGQNTFKTKITTIMNSEYKVSVRISDQLRRVVHQESITVSSHLPEMHFYELDSLYGLITWRGLQNAQLTSGDAVAIQAESFFLPLIDLENIDYEWSVNRDRIENRDKKNRIFRLSTENGALGVQRIFLKYSNQKNILQRGGDQIIVNVLAQ